MQHIPAITRAEGLAPPPTTPPIRKRRFGIVAFGFVSALGLGLAGGLNLHRLMDLNQSATWLQQAGNALQSGFEVAHTEIASWISGLTRSQTSVAGAKQPAPWNEPSRDDAIVRMVGDLSRQVDQVRAANEGLARDLGQGIERLRSAAELSHRELVAKLMHVTEKMEQVERQSVTAAPVKTQPAEPPIAAASAKPVTKPAQKPAFERKAKIAAKPSSTDAKPDMNVKGIANWTVREVFDDTAVLEGPRGLIAVGPGDTIPGIGQVRPSCAPGNVGSWRPARV